MCERMDIGGEFGGNREPAYLQLNPNGVVPTLIDGDTVVWESNAILRYLCNRFEAWHLYPLNASQRSWVERWMDWQLTTLGPANALLFQSIVRTPADQRAPKQIEEFRTRNAAHFSVLDQALKDRHFIAGATMTLADIALGAVTYRWFELPVERPDYPRLRRWYERLCERPAFQQHILQVGLR